MAQGAPGRHDDEGGAPVLRNVGMALLSMGLLSLAFHPADLPWLAWIGLVPWMAWHARRPRRGTGRALVVADYAHHTYLLWWAGEVHVALAFLVPLLGVVPSLLKGWLVDRAVHRWRVAPLLAYPLVFLSVELARDELLTLTWASPGYSQWRWLELVQLATLCGAYAPSFVVLFANAALAEVVLRARARPRRAVAAAAAAALLVVSAHLFGAWAMDSVETRPGPRAVGVQPNIPQVQKRRQKLAESWLVYERLYRRFGGRSEDPDLLVLPETCFFTSVEPDRPMESVLVRPRASIGGRSPNAFFPAGRGQLTVVGYNAYQRLGPRAGVPDENGDGLQQWNVAGVIRDGRVVVGEYAKRERVPFGEFVPLPQGFPGRERLKEEIREAAGYVPDLTAGAGPLVVPLDLRERGTVRFGLTICFEVVFPDYFRELVHEDADFVVNISNDGWYGDSAELDLVHVATRFRAVECRRSVLRVSNTGISTLVDPAGRYLDTVEGPGGRRKEVAGLLRGTVPVCNDVTPFARFGAWPAAAFPALLLLLAWRGRRRASPPA